MNNIGVVIQREYLTRVKKRSFIILTILMPFIMVLVALVPVLFSMVKDDSKKEVVVMDKTGIYEPLFIQAQTVDSTASDSYTFLPSVAGQTVESALETAEAVVVFEENPAKNPDAFAIYSANEVQQNLLLYVNKIVNDEVYREKIASYDIPELEKIIDEVHDIDICAKTIKYSDDGKKSESNTFVAVILGMITAFLIYMFVLIYGGMVMQSVMEEKTNRIVEVIVSSVKPFQLMMGKILAVMLVGFTQIFVWLLMLVAMFSIIGLAFGVSMTPDMVQPVGMAPGAVQQMSESQTMVSEMFSSLGGLPLFEIILLFILYFIGGYILYASFYAAIGASVNSQEDSGQFTMPMIMMMIIALYGALGSMENTDGPLAFWCSIFPLTSPIVMMVRIPFNVPLWQEILSLVLLYATAIGFVWAGGRIYRVGILMYGKKPTFKELCKWIRYK